MEAAALRAGAVQNWKLKSPQDLQTDDRSWRNQDGEEKKLLTGRAKCSRSRREEGPAEDTATVVTRKMREKQNRKEGRITGTRKKIRHKRGPKSDISGVSKEETLNTGRE